MEFEPGTDSTAVTASEAQAAEATLVRQSEDHTIAAAQVFDQQRDSAADGLASLALVP